MEYVQKILAWFIKCNYAVSVSNCKEYWSLSKEPSTEDENLENAPLELSTDGSPVPPLDLEATDSQKLFNEIIFTYFIPFEIWYTRTTVDKVGEFRSVHGFPYSNFQANRMSSPDVSQIPVITTTPDDVFYILKLVISRMISTGSVLVVEQTLEQLREIVDKDYVGIIKKKLDDVYRNQTIPGSNARADKIERENRMSFTVCSLLLSYGCNLTREQILLNDLDISASHLDRLTRDLAEGTNISQNFTNVEANIVKSYVTGFQSIEGKLKSTLRVGISRLLYEDII